MPRYDLVQTPNIFIVTVYCPDRKEEDIIVNFNQMLEINVATESDIYSLKFNLLNEIESEECRFTIYAKKIEFIISKKEKGINWSSFEKIPEQIVPDVSIENKKKSFDNIEDEPEDPAMQSFIDFVKGIYGNANAETQQAMIRSYVESGGTTLNMNPQKN